MRRQIHRRFASVLAAALVAVLWSLGAGPATVQSAAASDRFYSHDEDITATEGFEFWGRGEGRNITVRQSGDITILNGRRHVRRPGITVVGGSNNLRFVNSGDVVTYRGNRGTGIRVWVSDNGIGDLRFRKAGNIRFRNSGDVTTASDSGYVTPSNGGVGISVWVRDGSGDIYFRNTGDVRADFPRGDTRAIEALLLCSPALLCADRHEGDIRVVNKGDLYSGGHGIQVENRFRGSIRVANRGDIAGHAYGRAYSAYGVDIKHIGTGPVKFVNRNSTIHGRKGGVRVRHNGAGNIRVKIVDSQILAGVPHGSTTRGLMVLRGENSRGKTIIDVRDSDIYGSVAILPDEFVSGPGAEEYGRSRFHVRGRVGIFSGLGIVLEGDYRSRRWSIIHVDKFFIHGNSVLSLSERFSGRKAHTDYGDYTITGDYRAASGNFADDKGAKIAFDVNFADGNADLLVIGGSVAGDTLVEAVPASDTGGHEGHIALIRVEPQYHDRFRLDPIEVGRWAYAAQSEGDELGYVRTGLSVAAQSAVSDTLASVAAATRPAPAPAGEGASGGVLSLRGGEKWHIGNSVPVSEHLHVGSSFSEARAANGDMGFLNRAAALSLTWRDPESGLQASAQTQYSRFHGSHDLLEEFDGTAVDASVELGGRFSFGRLQLHPKVQVRRARIEMQSLQGAVGEFSDMSLGVAWERDFGNANLYGELGYVRGVHEEAGVSAGVRIPF